MVNIHGVPNVPGAGGHSPTSGPATFFDVSSNPGFGECVSAPTRSVVVPPAPFCVDVLHGVASFVAVVADHTPEQYPDPPSWGVSWEINGSKTPEIIVRRGSTYTFSVRGTAQHPFYITSDNEGGRSNADEQVRATRTADDA